MRSESAPAIGATTIGIAVHGSVLRPAPSGEWPCAVCRNCASRKIEPNIPKYMSSEAPFAAANARSRKSRSGTIGRGRAALPGDECGQQQRAAGERGDDRAARPAVAVPVHEAPYDAQQTAADQRQARPGRARPRAPSTRAAPECHASGSRIRPIGTLSQKIHCHERPSTTMPPTSGPGGNRQARRRPTRRRAPVRAARAGRPR